MKRRFDTNEFYHVFDRGVDKRKIFLDKSDYIRFIHDLYEFNDINPATQFSRFEVKNVGNEVSNIIREELVRIHAFVLMPNHHHLLIEQLQDNGISKFMSKLHGGYSRAFNVKHKRNGHLFQAPFESINVKNDIHLGFLICYLHANVLDLWRSNWKKEKLTNLDIEKAFKFLQGYRWSSYLDYSGIKNFPSVINKKFLLEFFDGTGGYKNFFTDWIKQYKKNVKYIKELIF